MTLRLNGSTSGYVEIDAPAVAGTSALTLPTGTGTIAKTTDQGLVHINTTTFSAVSSVSLNDVFTSVYENYKIVFSPIAGSVEANLNIRLRASGSDVTASNYKYIRQYFGTSSGTQLNGSASLVHFSYVVPSQNFSSSLDILSPNLSAFTGMVGCIGFDNAADLYISMASGVYNATTVADGFTIFPTSGTITGTIRCYGYKNS